MSDVKYVSYRTALRHLIKAGGKIMAATFVKENGEVRDMAFRRNVAKGVKSNVNNDKNDSRKRVKRGHMITVVEMAGGQELNWKTINLHTLKELRINKERFIIQ